MDYQKQVNPLGYHKRLPMQERFVNDPAKIKCVFGGNRSSKTETIGEYIVNQILSKPRQKWWAVAETFSDSVMIQQKKIWDLIPKDKIRYGSYDIVNGFPNRKLILTDGSMVVFKSYDQGREAFQGESLHGIWNDEEPPFDIYKEQRMRLVDFDGEMLLSMTSLKGMTELLLDIFEDHSVLESMYAPLVNKTLPRVAEKNGIRFYFLWTTENPYINQERLKFEMRFMPQQEIMSRIYGIPTNLSGKIYPMFSSDIHVLYPTYIPKKDVQIWMVVDPHDRKPFAMAWFAVHKTGTCYCIAEWPESNINEILYDDNTYDDYKKIIMAKEANIKAEYKCGVRKRILDPNFGNKTIKLAERSDGGDASTTPKKELAKRGLKFEDAVDALEAGHLSVRQKLNWEKKDNELVVQPDLFISEDCQNTIRHLSRYSRKDIHTADGDVKAKVGPKEKYKDYCDLVRYFSMHNPRYLLNIQPEIQKL